VGGGAVLIFLVSEWRNELRLTGLGDAFVRQTLWRFLFVLQPFVLQHFLHIYSYFTLIGYGGMIYHQLMRWIHNTLI